MNDPPPILTVAAGQIDHDRAIEQLVLDVRAEAAGFIFLSGGASKMVPESERALMHLFDAFTMLAGEGVSFGVGDGGTEAGIMKAAGEARIRSARPFPLIGVCPAPEIPPRGQTPVDPNHSVIVAVENPDWDGTDGSFGSETATMYALFARLSQNRPSVTVVANGGGITLAEVDENIRAARPMVIVRGSGRAADALISLLDGSSAANDEIVELRLKAERADLLRRRALFHVFDLALGPAAFAQVLRASVLPLSGRPSGSR